MSYSKGICWVADCRIPFVDEGDKDSAKPLGKTLKHKGWDTEKWLEETKEPNSQGRFTPNLLVCDDMLNDGNVSGGGKIKKTGFRIGGKSDVSVGLNGKKDAPDNYGDKGSNSRYYSLDLWFNKMVDGL